MTFYVYYITLLILFFIITLICQYVINRQQNNIASLHDSADDINKCPKTAKFLTEIQSGFLTNCFGIYSACVTGIIMILCLIGYSINENRPPPSYTIFYIFFTCIAVYIFVYKVSNCILARICNFHSCATKFIEKSL